MKKNFLKAAVMTLVAGGAIFGTAMVSDAANVRILPVDTAKFWAGARFDFDVEVSGAKNLENVKVDINGVPADKFFGKTLSRRPLITVSFPTASIRSASRRLVTSLSLPALMTMVSFPPPQPSTRL